MTSARHFRFGKFELQPDERRLLADGSAVRIGGHAFDVLLFLVQRSGQLVTKDELLERVWPRLVIEENTLHAHVSALRRILGAGAIETVSGHGYRFTPEATPVDVTATKPWAAPRHNVPQPLTTFVGRDREIAEIERLLDTTRLLTLTGAGGCGKTRLAMQVATERLAAYPDGIWFIELAPIAQPGLVPRALANVLGIKEQPGRRLTDTIVDAIATRHLLLVLDNAEHVLGACAEFADRALRECAHLTVIVTSRERLGIEREATYRVPSLSVPDATQATPDGVAASESGRLFIERARLQRPEFDVTPDSAVALAALCRRLDGIPFAIELAAARVRAMSVTELAQRLDHRFALLTNGTRIALPRHRTLRSLIDWSYDLLSGAEQAMLRRVSVFAGGWTLHTAKEVAAFDGIESAHVFELHRCLLEKNLVSAHESGGATRYGLLETVRLYALDQLQQSRDEDEQTRQRHLAHFLALAEEAEPCLLGSDMGTWLERLESEHDNLRAALTRAIAVDAARGLRLASALSRFWQLRGYLGEGRAWLARFLGASVTHPEADRARALYAAGALALAQGDGAAAEAGFSEALSIQRKLDDGPRTSDSLSGLGLLAHQRADYAAAKVFQEEALAIARRARHPRGVAVALNNLGIVAGQSGDFAASHALVEEALVLARDIGDRSLVASCLSNLGTTAYQRGELPAAQAFYEEALAIRRALGDPRIAVGLLTLGSVASARGDYAAAHGFHRESLAIHRDVGDRAGMAWSLEGVAFALAVELPLHAARIWGAAERLRAEIATPLPPRNRETHDLRISQARTAARDDAAFDRALQDGRAMTLEQAVRHAMDAR